MNDHIAKLILILSIRVEDGPSRAGLTIVILMRLRKRIKKNNLSAINGKQSF